MIRSLFDLAVIVALAIYLALMGEHHPLPAGLISRGGYVLLDDSEGSVHQ